MIGYLDEILDITYFGEDERFLAVAANSCDIHLFDNNMNCSLGKGHTDLVVSLATSRSLPNLLVSGSKVYYNIEFCSGSSQGFHSFEVGLLRLGQKLH